MMANQIQFDENRRKAITQCSRCGFCRAVCPIFELTKRPITNARGKMILLKEVMEGKLPVTEGVAQALLRCTTCMNCTIACPSQIKVSDIVESIRAYLVDHGFTHLTHKKIAENIEKFHNPFGEDDKAREELKAQAESKEGGK